MALTDRSVVFQVLTSIAGYGPDKVLTTDAKKQIKWVDKAQFINQYSPEVFFSDEDFIGKGTKESQIKLKN